MNFNASATSNLSSHGGECQHGFGDVLKYLLFGVIFALSLCGNGFVCWVVWRRQRMRTVMNYFLVNLAIDDLAFTLYWKWTLLLCNVSRRGLVLGACMEAFIPTLFS
ncbi:RYamide receptor-like isoform X1 [Acropora palmata]|uniref:RYamide receptor-like isoform X1 n=1 Tax=Acropora palmata TaxID=6131 RepID=UPI003DA13E3E